MFSWTFSLASHAAVEAVACLTALELTQLTQVPLVREVIQEICPILIFHLTPDSTNLRRIFSVRTLLQPPQQWKVTKKVIENELNLDYSKMQLQKAYGCKLPFRCSKEYQKKEMWKETSSRHLRLCFSRHRGIKRCAREWVGHHQWIITKFLSKYSEKKQKTDTTDKRRVPDLHSCSQPHWLCVQCFKVPSRSSASRARLHWTHNTVKGVLFYFTCKCHFCIFSPWIFQPPEFISMIVFNTFKMCPDLGSRGRFTRLQISISK